MRPCTDPLIVEQRQYPIAYLGDLVLFLVHYSSVEEANLKWQTRKQRIDLDNIAVFAVDKDGMTKELKDRFERLPYKKVMFSSRPDPSHPNCFYISGYENADIGLIQSEEGWRGKRPVDQFDWVEFLNRPVKKN